MAGPDTSSYDVIIVGGGSAGCVLASRLSERASTRVLLIEAGLDTPPGREPRDVLDVYPASYYNDAYMWPALRVHWRDKETSPATGFSQGRIMGGGSSVMGMVALRGTPDDFAEWQALGAAHWGWRDVLPYFRRLETDLDFAAGCAHGDAGPVPVRRVPEAQWPPLTQALRQFAEERQLRRITDMNAEFEDGFGAVPISNWPTKRASAAICYLTVDVRRRPNLRILSGATVTALQFEGTRAVGVEAGAQAYRGADIIVAAGAIHSPALLLRHGIGDGAALRALGLDVRADLPGVGANLQNHAILFLGAHLRRGARQSATLRTHPTAAFRYSSGLDGCPRGDMYLNIQSKTSWNAIGQQVANLAPVLLKPLARGRVSLVSASDAVPPQIEFNFAGHELDLARLVDGFCRSVEMLLSPGLARLTDAVFPVRFTDRLRRLNKRSPANAAKSALIARVLDTIPVLAGPVFATLTDTRTELRHLVADPAAVTDHVLRHVAGMFHVVGTCRMGHADDREAVVDPSGRVHGLQGLRVIDASIMPTIPRGNTNLATIMLAEKLAAEMSAA